MFEAYGVQHLGICEKNTVQMGLYVTGVGYLHAHPNYKCGPRVLDDYYMVYIEKGKGQYRCNGKNGYLKKGDIFFILPNVVHTYWTDTEEVIHQRWIGFKGICAKELVERLGITSGNCCVKAPSEETFTTLFESVYDSSQEGGTVAHLKCTAVVYSLFAEMLKDREVKYEGYEEQKHEDGVQRALSYIESHYYQGIGIQDVAQYAGVSRSYLATKFKKEVGCSPHEQLAKMRLNQAVYYLQYSDLSIERIAHCVGIEDAQYFSRFFKKNIGVPPSEFRQNVLVQGPKDKEITKASL